MNSSLPSSQGGSRRNPEEESPRSSSRMSKQVHEVRGQSIIRVSNQNKIPKVQEANSRKNPNSPRSWQVFPSCKEPTGRKAGGSCSPPLNMHEEKSPSCCPKTIYPELITPKSLGSWGVCRGHVELWGASYDDGLEYEFLLPLGSIPKHGVFIHVHQSYLSC